MNIRLAVLSPFLVAIMLSNTSAADDPPRVTIARFAGNRAAAVSYTFDDGLRDQYTHAVPMLDEAGFKGTFFIIPGHTVATPELALRKQETRRGWGGISWPELKQMAANGHEIANHTWSHRSLSKLTPEVVSGELSRSREEIARQLGKPPLTLAFPFNQFTPEILAAARESHVACRTRQTGAGGASTAASLNSWADKQVADKSWGVLMVHGITRGYAAFEDADALRDHFRYVKRRESEIWVDTFANVSRYEVEREKVKVSTTGACGNLKIFLSSPLDPEVFNVPLTIVIEAPGCSSVRVHHGAKELPSRVSGDSILLEALPGEDPIHLTWNYPRQ